MKESVLRLLPRMSRNRRPFEGWEAKVRRESDICTPRPSLTATSPGHRLWISHPGFKPGKPGASFTCPRSRTPARDSAHNLHGSKLEELTEMQRCLKQALGRAPLFPGRLWPLMVVNRCHVLRGDLPPNCTCS